MALTITQSIEYSHLAFLAVLRTQVDEGRYVLKGGANLRYFFDSPRYSEDIDLDTTRAADWRFEEQVDRTLSSDALVRLLRIVGISVDEDSMSKPKQTDYTRRWKVHFTSRDHEEKIRTKIEFSSPGMVTHASTSRSCLTRSSSPTRCDRPRCSTTT